MKKKIVIGLSVLLATCMLGACGASDPTEVVYNGVTYEELKQENMEYLQIVEQLYEIKSQGQDLHELVDQVDPYNLDKTIHLQVDAVEAWEAAIEECGAFVSVDEDSFTTTKSGKTVTSDVTVQFADRTATFEVVYTYFNMEVSGVSVTTDYSFGEKMSKAALNTVISMSIVFAVLVLIAFIIYGFNIFPYLEKKKKEKAAAAAAKNAPAAPVAPAAPAAPVAEENLMDDTELIAVIAAAIAASEGTSTSGFVVRSINRR